MSRLRLRASRLQWLDSDGEIVALDEESLLYLSANESGTLLWRALADGTTRDDLVALLTGRFGIEVATAAADVDRFLDDLARRGLLEQ